MIRAVIHAYPGSLRNEMLRIPDVVDSQQGPQPETRPSHWIGEAASCSAFAVRIAQSGSTIDPVGSLSLHHVEIAHEQSRFAARGKFEDSFELFSPQTCSLWWRMGNDDLNGPATVTCSEHNVGPQVWTPRVQFE